MNKKQLVTICGIGLSVLIIFAIVSISILKNEPSLTEQEIRKSIENEISKSPKITGDVALRICEILDIYCPSELEFNATFLPHDNSTRFNYVHENNQFVFKIMDDEICYTVKEIETCEDTRLVSVMSFSKGDMEFYENECIKHNGIWTPNNQCHFKHFNDHNVSEIIFGVERSKIQQQEIMSKYLDAVKNNVSIGSFKIKDVILGFSVSPDKGMQVSMLSDVYYSDGRNLIIDGMWDIIGPEDGSMSFKPLSNIFDEIQKSTHELSVDDTQFLLGDAITISGVITNPVVKYVVISIFHESNGMVENMRKDLDGDDFYSQEFKIKSDWSPGTYSVSIMPSEFDSVVYFDVLGTEEVWGDTNKSIQNFP